MYNGDFFASKNNANSQEIKFSRVDPLSLFTELQQILRNCYQNQPGIPLLLDEAKQFAMGDVFVDLELIESKENKDDKESKQEEIDTESRREFVGTSEKRQSIQPKDLFKLDANKLPIQRVFLQGAAGVGKTTLARYLLKAHADKKLLGEQFELIIYLPLREIILLYPDTPILRQEGYNLEKLILGNWEDSAVFHQRGKWGKTLIQSEHKHALWEFIQKHPDKILFVLDGLDEVDKDHPAIKAFLEYVTCYLLLSRPMLPPPNIQRRVENVGFSEAHVFQYIQTYFKLIEQPELAEPLILKLKENVHLLGFCSIAINCQLFCGAWQQLKAENKEFEADLTLTDRYDFIMLQWQRRALKRDSKITADRWKLMNNKDVQALCEDRMEVLRAVCLRAFQNNSVIISGDWLEVEIEKTLQQREEDATLDNKAKLLHETLSLGVLKRQGVNEHFFKDHYEAAHLTFLEYLVGDFLARGFCEPQTTQAFVFSRELLKNYLYHPKWAIVWRFMVGRLAKMQQGGVLTLLTGLLEGPQDLYCEQQVILLMHCYEEILSYLTLSEQLKASVITFFTEWFNYLLSRDTNRYVGDLDHFHSSALVQAFKQCPQLLRIVFTKDVFVKILQADRWDRIAFFLGMISADLRAVYSQQFIKHFVNEGGIFAAKKVFSVIAQRLSHDQLTPFFELIKQYLLDSEYWMCDNAFTIFKILIDYLSADQILSLAGLMQQGLINQDLEVRSKTISVLYLLFPRLPLEKLYFFINFLMDPNSGLNDEIQIKGFGLILPWLESQQIPYYIKRMQEFIQFLPSKNLYLLYKVLPGTYDLEQDRPFVGIVLRILIEKYQYLAQEKEKYNALELSASNRKSDPDVSGLVYYILKFFCRCPMSLDQEQLAWFITFAYQNIPYNEKASSALAISLTIFSPHLQDDQLITFVKFVEDTLLQKKGDFYVVAHVLKFILPQLQEEQIISIIQQGLLKSDDDKILPITSEESGIDIIHDSFIAIIEMLMPKMNEKQISSFVELVRKGLFNKDEAIRRTAVIIFDKLQYKLQDELLIDVITLLREGRLSWEFASDKLLNAFVAALLQLSNVELLSFMQNQLASVTSQSPYFSLEDPLAKFPYSHDKTLLKIFKELVPRLHGDQFSFLIAFVEQNFGRGGDFPFTALGILELIMPHVNDIQILNFITIALPNQTKDFFSSFSAFLLLLPRLHGEQLSPVITSIQEGLACGDPRAYKRVAWRLFKQLLPRLDDIQLCKFINSVEFSRIVKRDSYRAARFFIKMLPQATNENFRANFIMVFIDKVKFGLLRELKQEGLSIFVTGASTINITMNNTTYSFKVSPQQMTELKNKFAKFSPPDYAQLLNNVRNAVRNESDKLQQTQIASGHSDLPRNYIGGFALISHELCAVTLVRRKSQGFIKDLTSHVFIILESINEDNEQVLLKIHLTTDAQGQVFIQQETIKNINWIKGMSNGNYCYKGWQISLQQKEKLLNIIAEDQLSAAQGKLVYNRYGNGNIHSIQFPNGRSYHSCLSWTEATLKQIGLPMERHWLDMVITIPNKHLQEVKENSKQCVIS